MASAIKITLTPPMGIKVEQRFEGHSITIGRSKTCTLTVDSESLSRQHCLIELINGEFYITDLGSTNGVYIEGMRIEAHQKIRFNNFLNLQISNYECQVTELEDETVFSQQKLPPKHDVTQLELAPTKPTKKLNIHALNAPLPKVEKSPDQSRLRMALAIVILVLIGFSVFLAIEVQEEDLVETDIQSKVLSPAAQAKVQAAMIKTPNAFYKDYETLMFAKDCKEGSYCQNLQLSTSDNEGIYEVEKEIYIFINPAKHSSEKYSKLAAENQDLIALDILFNSIVLEAYFRGVYEQIHLIIVTSAATPSKVLKFHVSKYNFKNSQLETVLPLLNSSIEQNNPKPLIEVLYPLIDILDLVSNK